MKIIFSLLFALTVIPRFVFASSPVEIPVLDHIINGNQYQDSATPESTYVSLVRTFKVTGESEKGEKCEVRISRIDSKTPRIGGDSTKFGSYEISVETFPEIEQDKRNYVFAATNPMAVQMSPTVESPILKLGDSSGQNFIARENKSEIQLKSDLTTIAGVTLEIGYCKNMGSSGCNDFISRTKKLACVVK